MKSQKAAQHPYEHYERPLSGLMPPSAAAAPATLAILGALAAAYPGIHRSRKNNEELDVKRTALRALAGAAIGGAVGIPIGQHARRQWRAHMLS